MPGADAINNVELGKHGRNRTNVWSYPGVNTFRVNEGDDLALHPTVKPVAMIAEAVKDASDRGSIVLDVFLGSGTTLLACEKVGRCCSGWNMSRFTSTWRSGAGSGLLARTPF